MSRVTYMPRFCCVIGCRNTDKLPGLSVFFFRIPKLAKKQGVAHEKLLRERGEREFVVRLVQTPEHWRVCGKHFVSEPKTHRAPESISKRCHEGKQLADFEIADVKHQMSMNKEPTNFDCWDSPDKAFDNKNGNDDPVLLEELREWQTRRKIHAVASSEKQSDMQILRKRMTTAMLTQILSVEAFYQ
ncbi:uncharacterized protein LOC125042737 isoform X1 [Penaeus chinensis]|uniref:uncharacterized protein LOC125042737 isoform X1 n=1 Tax=Penaeus chinensis TaxID=139456 RepID=UPI001FB6C31A|nr:uncharacterized protein LOC125042737 isoform X1 [Penaeus chinensis]XP_047494547.1 uncharacterized protein LOC125042737 isoform X1 [Penaeus chinensis]